LAVFNLILLVGVFRFQTQDGTSIGPVPTPRYDTNMSRFIITVCRQEVGEVVHPRTEEDSPLAKFGQMMTHKAVHLLSIFLMVYIGVEVTIGGTIIHIVATNKCLMAVTQDGPHRS
jgi:hypothetical protein